MREPYSISLSELAAALRRGQVPAGLRTDSQLIYSSPASLDFNSPGAQGFGVKRAGLSIPGSIMLLISPGCCGRNTAALSCPDGLSPCGESYRERFAYLLLDENDIVTGRHLAKIPAAVQAFADSRSTPPTCVLLCLTCVDALLGTDMERIARRAAAASGLPVLPCYMYALTRESTRPPMAAVRETVYSLLEPAPKRPQACNLLGFFTPLLETSELFSLLQNAGLTEIRELSRAHDWQEYQELATANFNLVLHPEARLAADAMATRLQIPYIELKRLYETDKIERQYQALAQALGTSFATATFRQQAETAVKDFVCRHPSTVIGLGSRLNAEPFELALALVRAGLSVSEIYATPTAADAFYLERLSELSPKTRVYMNLAVSMAHYRATDSRVTLALGADACRYHPQAAQVSWNSERQPFGFQAVCALFAEMEAACRDQ